MTKALPGTLYAPDTRYPVTVRAQRLNDELKQALSGDDLREDLTKWGIYSAKALAHAAQRRVTRLPSAVINIVKKLYNETEATMKVARQGRLAEHLRWRRTELTESTKEALVGGYKSARKLAQSMRKNPHEAAVTIIAATAGFYLGSGGFDGNGGVPDQDISMFGIGDHRSILMHSILPGIVIEASVLSAYGLVRLIHERLPRQHDVFWDVILNDSERIMGPLTAGVSAGISYHLAVDSFIQTAPYKDLPFSMPIEGHETLMAANALGEASATGTIDSEIKEANRRERMRRRPTN
jgi:hypothetical protein